MVQKIVSKNDYRFLVTGGLQRDHASRLGEGHRYRQAQLVTVDFASKTSQVLSSYQGREGCYPEDTPNVLYTSCTLHKGRLYLCTETEIFVYRYPAMEMVQRVSHPFFQNVHHVAPVAGHVAVASTGLDMIVLLDKEKLAPVRFAHAMGKDPWQRFSRSADYRKVHSTKPHEAHPNFVFSIGEEIWVTRFNQKDAISLDDPSKRINIGVERVHDGHVADDYVYFTTVNGCIVVANIHTLKIEEIIDLNTMEEGESPLGWCRGLALMGEVAYVGFSRLRRTAAKENVQWARRLLGGCVRRTRIAAYDLRARTKLEQYVMPKSVTNVIYSVLPAASP